MPSKTSLVGYLNSGSIGINLADKSSTLWLQSCKHDYQQYNITLLLLVQDQTAEQNWKKNYSSNKLQAAGMAEAGLQVRDFSGRWLLNLFAKQSTNNLSSLTRKHFCNEEGTQRHEAPCNDTCPAPWGWIVVGVRCGVGRSVGTLPKCNLKA